MDFPRPRPNLIVSKFEKGGDLRTLGEALRRIPAKNPSRFVIYIKAGIYQEENVLFIRQENVTLYGDGVGKTIIRSDRRISAVINLTRSSALAISGPNFIAMGITFENTAGPSAGQAVAVRNDSDRSAFFKCEFLGHQDTLYVSSNKQFFRECVIQGTVDFIFGNAAVVFQKCEIGLREKKNRENVITAQSRERKEDNTGIVLHDCNITAIGGALGPRVTRNYLGRPWRAFARTVVMECNISGAIDPSGWLEWGGRLSSENVTYREYANTGKGSSTAHRVSAQGFKVITDREEAISYTVARFIDGEQWLHATNIPFDASLKS